MKEILKKLLKAYTIHFEEAKKIKDNEIRDSYLVRTHSSAGLCLFSEFCGLEEQEVIDFDFFILEYIKKIGNVYLAELPYRENYGDCIRYMQVRIDWLKERTNEV